MARFRFLIGALLVGLGPSFLMASDDVQIIIPPVIISDTALSVPPEFMERDTQPNSNDFSDHSSQSLESNSFDAPFDITPLNRTTMQEPAPLDESTQDIITITPQKNSESTKESPYGSKDAVIEHYLKRNSTLGSVMEAVSDSGDALLGDGSRVDGLNLEEEHAASPKDAETPLNTAERQSRQEVVNDLKSTQELENYVDSQNAQFLNEAGKVDNIRQLTEEIQEKKGEHVRPTPLPADALNTYEVMLAP